MIPFIQHKDRKLFLHQYPVVADKLEETVITSDAAAAASSITVRMDDDVVGYAFGINQILLLGEWGAQDSELVTTHASTVPVDTTITLSAATNYAHNAGTKVYRLRYNQVEFSRAGTATGTKTALTTSTLSGIIPLQPNKSILSINEGEYSSGFYFARFLNSITTTFTAATTDIITSTAHGLNNGETIKVTSGTTLPAGLTTETLYYVISSATNTFSVALTSGGSAVDITDTGTGTHSWRRCGQFTDALTFGGWPTKTAGYAMDYALSKSKTSFTEEITRNYCYDEMNACLKYIQGKQVHWDEQNSANAILGQTTRGLHIFALSGLTTEIYDNDTNKSIVALRVGPSVNLAYKDPEEWEQDVLGEVKYTKVTTAASAGATTLAINNSYDFSDTGTVNVYVSGTKDAITYTGVTRSATAGVLTGIPASGANAIGQTIAVDTYVWQGEDEGQPAYFTVRNQSVEIYPLPDGNYDNMNVTIDYFTICTEVDTDADEFDVSQTYPVKYWLTAKVRAMRNTKGVVPQDDPDIVMFRETLNDLVRTKRSAYKYPSGPRLNRISY